MEEAGVEDRPDSVTSKTDKKEPKLTNQFNFSERASQTLNNPLRVGSDSIAMCIIVEISNSYSLILECIKTAH